MYEIQGRIVEQHGDYQCYLEAWSAESTAKVLLFSTYETLVNKVGDLGDEHLEIVEVLREVLRRNAEKFNVPLF